MRQLTHRSDGIVPEQQPAFGRVETPQHLPAHVTLDPAAVRREMREEELYSGHGFHPPLRPLP